MQRMKQASHTDSEDMKRKLLTVDYLITTLFKETAHLLTEFQKPCHKRQGLSLGLFSLLNMLNINDIVRKYDNRSDYLTGSLSNSKKYEMPAVRNRNNNPNRNKTPL